MFRSPDLYDRSINWDARLSREIPVLCSVFGPPGDAGLVDAGCGSGRHATALGAKGYHIFAIDQSADMLALARRIHGEATKGVEFVECDYSNLGRGVGRARDGLYCLGNSLAAAGSRDAAREAMRQFGLCLRPGGRLFIQVLNFAPMRGRTPCVLGPRVSTVDGKEILSYRHFHFGADVVDISHVVMWKDAGGWTHQAQGGRLYPVERDELLGWAAESGFRADDAWGDYERKPFDPASSADLILVATRA